MIALATAGVYLPASNRPESIHLRGLRPVIDELRALTLEREKESARAVLVDTAKGALIVSSKTTVGDDHSTWLIWAQQPGREKYQKRALPIHVHPDNASIGGAQGFSDGDYVGLLADRETLGAIMVFGKDIFLVLKTSVTPNNLSRQAIEKRVSEARQDYYDNGMRRNIEGLVAFNKAVCAEFGLVLYLATSQTRDLAKRVTVAFALD